MSEHWLVRWRYLLRDRSVLEIGCGEGIDSAQLEPQAQWLLCSDQRVDRIARQRHVAPQSSMIRFDHSRGFPLRKDSFDVVVAGLSLHYFDRLTMQLIREEIARVLKPGGYLLVRLNSDLDVNHGAGTGEEIEPGFFQLETVHAPSGLLSQCKRFFTRSDIQATFHGCAIEHLEETSFEYYGNVKVAWELMVRLDCS
jgi:SAM-dependent methyltransferase